MNFDETTKVRILHERYIQGTSLKAPVKLERVLIAHLSNITVTNIEKKWQKFSSQRVYLGTVALKHIFDNRAAQEYDTILEYLHIVLEKPDEIYQNIEAKTGKLVFIKTIASVSHDGELIKETLLCSVDISEGELEVVTAFRFRNRRKKRNYLEKYKLLWNWESDNSPS